MQQRMAPSSRCNAEEIESSASTSRVDGCFVFAWFGLFEATRVVPRLSSAVNVTCRKESLQAYMVIYEVLVEIGKLV